VTVNKGAGQNTHTATRSSSSKFSGTEASEEVEITTPAVFLESAREKRARKPASLGLGWPRRRSPDLSSDAPIGSGLEHERHGRRGPGVSARRASTITDACGGPERAGASSRGDGRPVASRVIARIERYRGRAAPVAQWIEQRFYPRKHRFSRSVMRNHVGWRTFSP
jgi:hypothetical protein